MEMPSFPTPVDDDAEDVVLALETAGALWSNGNPAEALRWLRRAADSAEQAGNDLRAVALAKTAAELTPISESVPPKPATVPPPPPEPPALEPALSGPPPLPDGALGEPAVDAGPPSAAPDDVTASGAAVPETAGATRHAPVEEAQPPLSARGGPPPLPGDASAAAPNESGAPSPAPVDAGPPPLPGAEAPSPAPPSARPATKATNAHPPSTNGHSGGARSTIKVRGSSVEVDVRNALRVSVKQSARDDKLYVARLLDDDGEPPLGGRSALLVLLDEG